MSFQPTMISKLVVGSANFGLKYGIANQKKLEFRNVGKILGLATRSRMWGIDTAKDYVGAEIVIGKFFKRNSSTLKIISKLPDRRYISQEAIIREAEDSLIKLNIPYIDYLLIHSYKTYSTYKEILIRALTKLKKKGKIHNWGVSLYHPFEAEEMLEDGLTDIAIEFPLNLFDRRFLKNKLLEKLKRNRYHLFSRSVFLQGLFFLAPQTLASYFEGIKPNINILRKLSDTSGLDIVDIALLFVLHQKLIDGVIIGVDSEKQLLANIKSLTKRKKYQKLVKELTRLEVTDDKIILPYLWPTQQKRN